MAKFFIILKREYAQIVRKKSFIIGIFLTPIFMGGVMLLPLFFATRDSSESERLAIIDRGDLGVGKQFTKALNQHTLTDDVTPAYTVVGLFESDARDAPGFEHLYDSLVNEVTLKRLKYFLVVEQSAHAIDTGIYLVTNSDNFRSIRRFETSLSDILTSHRLQESEINLPVDSVLALTQSARLAIRDTTGESIPFEVKYFAALIFVMLMYVMIIAYGATLMRSIIEEKTSRIMEVLVSSVTPFQLMAGKLFGMGAAAFTQVAIWVGIGLILFLARGPASLEVEPAIERIVFNWVIVLFFILFFLAGYIMYSSLFALIGSIVNSDKEAQSFIFPITISLMVPVIIGISIVQDPHATWVMVLAYIPFFTPTLMLMRVIFLAPTATSYSLFSGIFAEATVGWLLVVATTLGILWLTSRIFRVGILMYGKRPTLAELIRWVRY